MGIISGMERRAVAQSLGPPRDPVIAAWFGGSSNSATGLSVTPESAMRVTAVYRAVMLKAQTFASLPLGVFLEHEDGGKSLDKKHPLYHVLHDQPNQWQTSFEWREMMAGHFELRNRCYSEIIGKGGKGVDQLVPLHPDRVRPFRAPNGSIAFSYTPLDGPSRIILQGEMHYLHGMIMGSDGVTPLSPISTCREAIGLALAAEEYSARLFGNGTMLGGILKMAGHLKDDPAREKLLKSWKEAYSGVSKAGKTALLEDGLDWKSLGMTPEDAQLILSRQMSISEIARLFGVPPHKLGDLERSTNNNIEHQGIEWVTDSIRPGAVRWEQAFKRDLFYGASAATHCAEFDLDGLMRGDMKSRYSGYAVGRQWGWLNVDEVRAKESMNPLPDKAGQVYMTPMNMTEAGKQTEKLLNDKTN